MSGIVTGVKRALVGSPQRSEQIAESLLPKRIALPVFASDALSSNAYATEEILLVLSVGGSAFLGYAPWVALGVILLMFTVVASYRQNVRAYPSGGGDYEVVTTNVGPRAGLLVASALLVDYVLTVAVSISSAVANLASALPVVSSNRVAVAVVLVVIITVLNLRGVRESGSLFAVPTYMFILGIFVMLGVGAFRMLTGDAVTAQSSGWSVKAVVGPDSSAGALGAAALVFLLLRAFASGCTALTGVEAIANGVPAFRKPKSQNAATTLLMLGLLAVTMFGGITVMAMLTGVKVAEVPEDLIGVPAGVVPKTVIAQVAEAIFSGPLAAGFLYVSITTALILMLAANTAFNGFPVLGSVMARDGWLPRQLQARGDRLAYSNGIVFLALAAIGLVIAFDAEVTRLIQLYIVGVFISFTFSQFGMIRHWNRHLRDDPDAALRAKMRRNRVVNALGFTITGAVLTIVLVTKFTRGAWIVCVAIPILILIMMRIKRHYSLVAQELQPPPTEMASMLPSRVHAVVLVSKVHRPTLRAIAYARATRPSTLTAITVSVDPDDTAQLVAEWAARRIPVPLTVLSSPYREVTRPLLDYVRAIQIHGPRDLVTVFIPEYVVGRWWEGILHNQSALRLKARLRFAPGVMVVSVPWQLRSSELAVAAAVPAEPGPVEPGPAEAVARTD